MTTPHEHWCRQLEPAPVFKRGPLSNVRIIKKLNSSMFTLLECRQMYPIQFFGGVQENR